MFVYHSQKIIALRLLQPPDSEVGINILPPSLPKQQPNFVLELKRKSNFANGKALLFAESRKNNHIWQRKIWACSTPAGLGR
jgi:hypothetical protein